MTNGTRFATTVPFSEVEEWAGRADVVSRARARSDLDPDRTEVTPGLRHLARVLRSLFSGRPTVLYSVCPRKLDFIALVIAGALFPGRVGKTLVIGDMWEPGEGLSRRVLGLAIRMADRAAAAWVVHTDADRRCFVEDWKIESHKVRVARAGVTADWDRYGRRAATRPYVFAGGNTLRDYRAVTEAAKLLPDVDFVFATTIVDPSTLPNNVELIGTDRRRFQQAMTGAALTIVPLRAGVRRSAGQQTYLNAMRAGSVPIVVDGPGVKEHITDGVEGLVVDGSAASFAAAIAKLLDPANRPVLKAMSDAATVRAAGLGSDRYPLDVLAVLDSIAEEPEPIEVAFVIQGYLPVVGGAQRQLAQLLGRYRAGGIHPTVVTRPEPGSAATEAVQGGGSIHRIGATKGSGPVRSLAFTAAAVRWLRSSKPDVIQAFDLLSPTTTALLAKAVTGAPVVVKVLRGGELGDLARLRTKPMARRRIEWMTRQLDRVVVISDEIERELLDAGFSPEQLVRIPNGVDLDRFAPLDADERARLRNRHGLPDGPLAIFTGRLNEEKRVDLLIEQWRNAVGDDPSARLLIVGDGPERQALQAIADRGVVFTGAVEDVTDYLRCADVFVLPSSTEGLSNSLLEAMAAGLTVVCTAVGGAVELIEDGVNGLLIPADDGPELGRALTRAVADPVAAAEMGRAARATMEERFSLDGAAAAHLALFRSLAGRDLPVEGTVPSAEDPVRHG